MSDASEIADQLLRTAASVSSEPTLEERNFSSLVRTTRNNFRRHESTPSPKRGRKRKRTFKKKVVLMKLAHADFFPCKTELKFLKERGLGEPDRPLEIGRDSSVEDIMEAIVLLFRPNIQNLLRMCGFQLAKLNQSKRILHLENFENGADLEAKIMQSIIVVLPHKDFPNDLPVLVLEEQDASQNQSTSRNSIQSLNHTSYLSRRQNDFENSESSPSSSARSHSMSHSSEIRVLRMQSQRIEESEEDSDDNDDNQLSIIDDSNITDNCVLLPSFPEDAATITIEISRNDCLNDLLNLYKDEDILNKKLNVQFLGEIGIDGGGLTKELFSIFFEQCEKVFFQGEDCLIPYLPLNKRNEQDKYIIIVRILQHMLLLTQTLPAKLSRISLMLIANHNAEVTDTVLLQELLRYVNPYLRKVLKKGQKNFILLTDKEKEITQDFFQTNKFFARPSPDSFLEQIKIIATEILVETPRKLIEKIRQGISPNKHPNFWQKCNFDVFMDMQTPTPTKVVNCLVTEPHLTNEETEVFHYLTMYINCLDKDKLSKLIFLITGSFLMPLSIKIQFNDSVGLNQRPIFSTCTDTLTLPRTYANYSELKNDLNICLDSDEAKKYTTY